LSLHSHFSRFELRRRHGKPFLWQRSMNRRVMAEYETAARHANLLQGHGLAFLKGLQASRINQ
jgi:hypothetical protein